MNKIFLIVVISTLAAIWLYTRSCLWRYVVYPSQGKSRNMWVWDVIFFGMHSITTFYRFYPTDFWNTTLGTVLGRAGYFFMGLCWLLCVWGIILDLVSLLDRRSAQKDGVKNPSRRLLPQKALVYGGLGVVAGTSALGVYHALNSKVYDVDIPLAKKFPKLKGLTITQLSDIHIGPTLKGDFLEQAVSKANALSSDIIVITGDLVDGFVEQLKGELQALKKLKAPLGVFYVTGNHEYYWKGQEWVDFVDSLGITVLMNSHKSLKFNGESFYLAGVTDKKMGITVPGHGSDPFKALPRGQEMVCKIMLAHRPKSCYEAQAAGAHLQLSGHTHGGQGIPWKFLVKIAQPYLAGLYDHKGMWLYVNRGTGFWGPPVRAGIQSEITKLTIV